MKLKYTGIGCGRIQKGKVYDADIKEEGSKKVVCVQGEGFKYTFTYNGTEQLGKDWEVNDKN